MAYAKGIYTSGTESKKKKKTPDPAKSQPTVTSAPVQKPVKPETVNVPAQTANEAKQEQLRDQQYRARQTPPDTEAEPVHKPVKPAAVNVPAQSTNAARAEQLAAQQRRRQQAEPRKGQSLAAAKEQAEEAWQRWLWREDYNPNNPTKLEDFYRKAGIPLSQNASFDGRVPTLEQLQEAVQRDRAETLSTEAARREQIARRKRELEELDARMEREWYSDDPQWQATHRDVDEARDEQLAARRYQEQRERGQKAYDLSTQAALDEKLAAKKRIAIQPIKEYDENDNAWNWFVKNSNMYSPYQDVWESLSKKPESHLKTVVEWLLDNPSFYSPHQGIWESLEDTPDAYAAIKNYFTSAKRVSPTQFQVVVDSDSDMIIHTVIHLGKIALDAVSMVSLFTAGVSSVAASTGTLGAGMVLGEHLLEGSAMAGVSLTSDAATLFDDIAHYCGEGKIIVTMGPESTSVPDLLAWIAI